MAQKLRQTQAKPRQSLAAPMEQKRKVSNWISTDSYFVPLTLVVVSLLLMTGGQIKYLLTQEERMAIVREGQDKPLEDARRVRAQFDSIATETARLAAQGNPNAGLLLRELEKQGVTITLPEESTK